MTMTVTMLTTVMGEAGTLLVKDSQYTVSDKFGAELVGLRRAIDTNGALTPQNSTQPAFWNSDGTLRTPAGGSVSAISVVSSAAPSNADGRPDGTIYIQTV